MNTKKSPLFKVFIILFLFFSFVFCLAKSYADTVFTNISDNFLRLHVVANSDTTEDQMLKYEIRDAILNYISPYLKNANSKQDAIDILNENINEIYKLSYNVLENHNLNYPLKISISNSKFPTKDYSNIILPEGNYDALKVEIGDAKGQNWWCVMFPSICIIDSTNCNFNEESNKLIKENLDTEEFSIITKNNSSSNIKIKFKLIELFENL